MVFTVKPQAGKPHDDLARAVAGHREIAAAVAAHAQRREQEREQLLQADDDARGQQP